MITAREIVQAFGGVELATLVRSVPSARDYTAELKYDGYRMVAIRAPDAVRLLSRRRLDWTRDFPEVARAVGELDADDAILDGEVCAPDERGVPSFSRLQRRVERGAQAGLVYVAFDVLRLDGEDLRDRPIEARRARLADLYARRAPEAMRVSSSTDADPTEVLRVACELGFEGIVCKRRGSPYRAGKGRDWLKVKCEKLQCFVVIGYLGSRAAIGSLLLAVWDEGLVYAGRVGTGFRDEERAAWAELLNARPLPSPPARGVPRFAAARFSEPRVVVEVAFTEWTDGKIRRPSFRGVRTDRRVEQCGRA